MTMAVLLLMRLVGSPGYSEVPFGLKMRAEAEQLAQPSCGLKPTATIDRVHTERLCKVKRAGAELNHKLERKRCAIEGKCIALNACGEACR